ncbi:ATP-binding protein [Chitinibacter tainanensis]|uniref:ATP-binding protein n=1 Tax=Chitinibacter tainanensis TaxID=230667 RepID=UPI000415562F|nr:ATP-binding protein [Chitinibacter tainanensis]
MIHLTEAELAQAFPFYLALNPEGQIYKAGVSLCKAFPSLAAGQYFEDCFAIVRPKVATVQELAAQHDVALVVQARQQGALRLRGNILVRAEGLLLLLSPVLTSSEEMQAAGLGMGDFAFHDASGDMLLMHRTNQMSLADANRLASRLRNKSKQLDTVMRLSPDGLAYFGADGVLNYANPSFQRLLGLSTEQLDHLQRRDFEVWLQTAQVPACPSLAQMLDTHLPLHLSFNVPYRRVIELQGATADEEGGVVLYLRDITAEVEANRLKTEFLTMAAHELRTPLASIRGFSELLVSRPVPAAMQQDMLATINRQSVNMTELIEDLLSLSKLDELTRDKLKLANHDLRELLEMAVSSSFAGADDFLVTRDYQVEQCLVQVDRHVMLKLFSSLFSNVIKFSPEHKQVDLQLRPQMRGDAAGVLLSIRDHGIGMKPEQLEHAFERFYRADHSGHQPGTGLGLAMSKDIVRLHAGDIALDSRPAAGVTVSIWLPQSSSAVSACPTEHCY